MNSGALGDIMILLSRIAFLLRFQNMAIQRFLPDLLSTDIEAISTGLCDGLYTSVDLTSAYLARIDEINPLLKAVIETNKVDSALSHITLYTS